MKKKTNSMIMNKMIKLATPILRGSQEFFLIDDMPKTSYEVSKDDCIINELRFIKDVNYDGIELIYLN